MLYNGKDIESMTNDELSSLKTHLDSSLKRLTLKQNSDKFRTIVKDNPINPAFLEIKKFVELEINKRMEIENV